ncbi:MAG: rhodanese-like domain-containing protein [Rhodospirillales bacterium]
MDGSLPNISPKDLNSLIGTAACPIIIDVRKRPAFDAAKIMIATAAWRDYQRAVEWAADLPQDKDVVVYCVHGHEVSQGAAAVLQSKGLRVRYLAGGIEAFEEAGGKLMSRAG